MRIASVVFTTILVLSLYKYKVSAVPGGSHEDSDESEEDSSEIENLPADPKEFMVNSRKYLQNIFKKCGDVVDTYFPNDGDMEAILIKCQEDIKKFSDAAKSIESKYLNNSSIELINALKELELAGGLLKLGIDNLQLDKNLQDIKTALSERDFIGFDSYDDDVKYSLGDIKELIMKSQDVNEIRYYWQKWTSKLGHISEKSIHNLINIIQNKAKQSGVSAVKYWYPNYSPEILYEIEQVMTQIQPLYKALHAYIRHKLFTLYGAGIIKPNGPIPENLYKQFYWNAWYGYSSFFEDFKESLPDFDEYFIENKLDGKQVLELAERFYHSIGFENLSDEVWQNQIFVNETLIECPGVVDDLSFKSKLIYCNSGNFEAYRKFHILLGEMHSSVLSDGLSQFNKLGHDLGEPIGIAAKLSAMSSTHLDAMNLSSEFEYTNQVIIHMNLHNAIEELLSIPYAYVELRVVTEYLDGKIKKEELRSYYWQLLGEYAGVEPIFDINDISYDLSFDLLRTLYGNKNIIQKFSNKILGYQFYKVLCQHIGHVGLLSKCDLDGKTEIAPILKEMYSEGSWKSSKEILSKVIKGYKALDGQALLDYFEPVASYLNTFSYTNNLTLGWKPTTKNISKLVLVPEEEAQVFVEESSEKIFKLYDQIFSDFFNEKSKADEFNTKWENEFWLISSSALAARELKDISIKAKYIDVTDFENKTLINAIAKLSKVGDVFVLGKDLDELFSNKGKLMKTSTDRDILQYKSPEEEGNYIAYYPDIRDIFVNSSDAEELKYYWKKWRDVNKAYTSMKFFEILQSFTKAAEVLGISANQFWFKQYSPSILDEMEKVIIDLKPLYSRLIAYLRGKIIDKYSYDDFSTFSGSIPDHYLQQLLVQLWTNKSVIESDFPRDKLPPYDKMFNDENYNALQLLNISDEFYHSLGFEALDEDFWTVRLKPQNDENVTDCHATIYDMIPKAYMKYCENVNFKKFLQAHGYMGRIHYADKKSHLPAYFFDSYYFEYPVGEAVILSASSFKHLQTIGILDDKFNENSILMNRLIRLGTHTLINIHRDFVYMKLVSGLLDNTIKMEDVTKYYWKLMIKYAGIEPAMDRMDEDFDFPFQFYADLEQNHHLKKFVSDVLGYQIYDELCKISGHTGELNNCDFYRSKEAGLALRKMMELGSSKSWRGVLHSLLGKSAKLSASSLLKYYEPLLEWLNHNVDFNDIVAHNFSDKKFLRSENLVD